MTTQVQARQVVTTFSAARTAGDRDAASSMLAPAFTFQSPMMRIDDSEAYLKSHIQFQRLVTDLQMISELYGDDEATLIYDLHTATPAGIQRTAEHFTLTAGNISSILLIFDATPWRPFLAAAGVVTY